MESGYHPVMATTTQRTILSSAKVGTISPQAARKSVIFVKYGKRPRPGKFTLRAYKMGSLVRKTSKK